MPPLCSYITFPNYVCAPWHDDGVVGTRATCTHLGAQNKPSRGSQVLTEANVFFGLKHRTLRYRTFLFCKVSRALRLAPPQKNVPVPVTQQQVVEYGRERHGRTWYSLRCDNGRLLGGRAPYAQNDGGGIATLVFFWRTGSC